MPTPEGSEIAKAPARLFGCLAREAPIGVIVRRGPSNWVRLTLWHTDTDTFEHGQWFKGRIYERSCDLSPDGSKLLYSGYKYHLEKWATSTEASGTTRMWQWTAISKPPYFTALALWADPELSGALFIDDHTLFFVDGSPTPSKGNLPPDLNIIVAPEHEENIFAKKMLLYGWRMKQERMWLYPPGRCIQPEIWRKEHPDSSYAILLKTDYYMFHYFLERRETGEPVRTPGATWIDFDQQGRVVFARAGQLFSIEGDNLDPKPLADFNSQEPAAIVAPDWAKQW